MNDFVTLISPLYVNAVTLAESSQQTHWSRLVAILEGRKLISSRESVVEVGLVGSRVDALSRVDQSVAHSARSVPADLQRRAA